METELSEIILRLMAAFAAGSIIGLERSFHGRPAGFRTHALVCLASSLLMLVTLYQFSWLDHVPAGGMRIDPTRMEQGIMTGIGFLGAGVIFKEGLSVRGLTTAASIWVTAAIGILFGVGFSGPALIATALTLATLSLFRWIETLIPTHTYTRLLVRFDRQGVMAEPALVAFLSRHGFTVSRLSHQLCDDGQHFEYGMTISTVDPANLSRLAADLNQMPGVRAFRTAPTD